MLALFGERCTYEIAYGDRDLIEQLDTLPRRELVDRFEPVLNQHKPELLLLPALPDYDQDHQAVFHAAHAAARPIAAQFGKWLVPHVLAYEMTKLQWASEPLPRFAAFTDITDVLETKLEAVRRYATMLRPSPHIRSLESVQRAGDDPRGRDRRRGRRGLLGPTHDPLAGRPRAGRARCRPAAPTRSARAAARLAAGRVASPRTVALKGRSGNVASRTRPTRSRRSARSAARSRRRGPGQRRRVAALDRVHLPQRRLGLQVTGFRESLSADVKLCSCTR